MTPGDQNPNRYKNKTFISAALAALIAAGASVPVLYNQLLTEKEGTSLTAYRDGVGIWTICKGLTRIYGRPVMKNDRLTQQQCDELDMAEQAEGLAAMERMLGPKVWGGLSDPAKAGLTSWCAHNIGMAKCRDSTAIRRLRDGDRNGACAAITLWIKDQGKDCRDAASNCLGQVPRRQLEDELCLKE